MITICNFKTDKFANQYDHSVDRKTPLGNPYPLSWEMDRDTSIEKYKEYFYNFIVSGVKAKAKEYLDKLEAIYKESNELRLFCWCAPLRCHAEIIKEYLEKKGGHK